MVKVLTITGMSCDHCARRVCKCIEDIGATVTSINVETGKTVVYYDNNANIDNRQLGEAVSDAGYDVVKIEVID